MNRRGLLKMTTALGAGGATVYAGMLLAAENAGSALAGARKATSNGAAGTNTAAAANTLVGSSPIAELPRASFIHRKDGTALFYKDWGAGTPVVFLHGAGLNSNMWMYQMVPLTAHGMRCVAYDRRGHGRSSDPGRGYDFDTLADDLAAVLEALNLRNVTLVGHSMASGEIVRYLTRHGSSRVSRVAMLGPTTPFLMKTADNPEGYDRAAFEALRALWLKDFPKWLKDNSPPFFMPETSPQMHEWGTAMMYQTSFQAQIQCNIAVTETDFRAELPNIKVPVLVIHGTRDVSAPIALTGQRTAKLIPGAALKVYEGAPHGLFVTHMEQVNQDLLAFIRG
jgi:non-heme chloroperoxidase